VVGQQISRPDTSVGRPPHSSSRISQLHLKLQRNFTRHFLVSGMTMLPADVGPGFEREWLVERSPIQLELQHPAAHVKQTLR